MRVLVLCHGNVNRSPLAAAVLRAYDYFMVQDGGLAPDSAKGRVAAKKTREFAEEYGYDLTEHRSQLVDEGSVHWAEWVIMFDKGNERRFTERFPQHVHKIINFGIRDPGFMAKDSLEFKQTQAKVIQMVKAWAEANKV